MTTACIAGGCAAQGRHLTDCPRNDCRGCLPRLALDGLRLCPLHRGRLAEDAIALPGLYDALALALTSSGTPGEKVTRSDGSPGINGAAADARTGIRSTLVTWCRLIAEERGIGLPSKRAVEELPLGFIGPPRIVLIPDDRPKAMGAYLARHADWLAAHPAADEVADQLHELAHGQAYRIAYPGGSRKFPVALPDGAYATCPEILVDEDTTETEPCPGTLWTILRRDASLLPSEIACNHHEEHRWPTSRWIKLGARLMAGAA